MKRCLLSELRLHQNIWGENLNTAVYLLNRLPTKSHNFTSYQLLTNKMSDLRSIKIFCCKVCAYLDKSQKRKLEDKAIERTFVDYDNRSKSYRIYIVNKKIIWAWTAKFIKNFIQTKQHQTLVWKNELAISNNPNKQR